MKRRMSAKHLRHNALARYISEASYSFVNEGFLDEKDEPSVGFRQFFRTNSLSPSPDNEDSYDQELLPQEILILLLTVTSESVPDHPATGKAHTYLFLISDFSNHNQQIKLPFCCDT